MNLRKRNKISFFVVTIIIFGSIAITPISQASFFDRGISLPEPVQKVINEMSDIKVNIDLGGFINRLKSDFKPKEWASGGKIVQWLENAWIQTNAWMESHFGISIQKIGRLVGSIFIWIFEFSVGILKKVFSKI